jgi:hypothetical protein
VSERIDLGSGHSMEYFSWAPDDLPGNRAAFGFPLPNVPKAGATIYHQSKTDASQECSSGIYFDLPELQQTLNSGKNAWQVQSWEPLTVSPSLLCLRCGDHGFIREGRWVPA